MSPPTSSPSAEEHRAPSGLRPDGYRPDGGFEPNLPRDLGRYTLLQKLASGGMAELFLAVQKGPSGFRKLVVIKRIVPSMGSDHGFIGMLEHEAQLAGWLSHPNLVQILELGQVDDTHYIAMEHVDGRDVRSIVRAMAADGVREFPLEHALAIVCGLCSGLAHAHEARDLAGRKLEIVHRDVSPQNVVVTFEGHVKLVDFGIAKSGCWTGKDTLAGQLKGKLPYMSPEQASGQRVDWRTDIFAAGVMLFELTTGRRLFKGTSEFETLKLVTDGRCPTPSSIVEGYPPALERIVMRALAAQKDDRYQSARDLQRDLERFACDAKLELSVVNLSRWMKALFAQERAAREAEWANLAAAYPELQPSVFPPLDRIAPALHPPARRAEARPVLGAELPAAAPAALQDAGPRDGRRSGLRRGGLVLGATALLLLGAASSRSLPSLREDDAVSTTDAPARGLLEVRSVPEGAAIWIDGSLQAERTPARIRLPLHRAVQVELSKEGFTTERSTAMVRSADTPSVAHLALQPLRPQSILASTTNSPVAIPDAGQR